MDERNIQTDYLRWFLSPDKLQASIDASVRILRKYEFDAIAFCGMSGALIAPAIALEMNKEMLMVRKKRYSDNGVVRNDHHSCYRVEGDMNARNFVIVDDFIASGETVLHILAQIKDNLFNPCNCLGVLEVNRIMDKRSEDLTFVQIEIFGDVPRLVKTRNDLKAGSEVYLSAALEDIPF